MVALDVVEPQVPFTRPTPPRVRLFTPRLVPVILAVAEPDGAILRLPFARVELLARVMDFEPLPENIRLLYVYGPTVWAAPL